MAGRGRPRAKHKREHMVGVHLTTEEYERLRTLAFRAHKTLAGYLRDLALAAK